MGHFLDIAQKVLSEVRKPLSYQEITDTGLKNGWLRTKGKTPAESMRARLSTDILRKKEKSVFMRTAAGTFGLRSWADREEEYVAPRFKKSLLDEDVLVFPAASLTKYIPGRGLHASLLKNRAELIAELKPMLRRIAEEDFSVIQLVSAFIIRFGDKYLTYKRTKRLPETRLHGYYSVPFGGHLNPDDVLPLFDIFDPKNAPFILARELREEIRLRKNEQPKMAYKGLLYDDSREVSRQHLGVVYDVYFDSPEFVIGERGFLMDAKFETLGEIEARIQDFENWSWIVVDYEKSMRRTTIESR